FHVTGVQTCALPILKQFSKWAGELGIPYNLVDDGWNNWKDGDKDSWTMMKDLVDYSRQQGVAIWLWKAYPDFKGIEGINTPWKRSEERRVGKEWTSE